MNDVTKSPHFQFKKSFDFPFLSMTSQNGEIIKNNANVTWNWIKKTWYFDWTRDCVRSNSEKQDSENKQKLGFLLTSANKDSLSSGIQTYFS